MPVCTVPLYMEPIQRFLSGQGELCTSRGAMNLYEFLLYGEESDNVLTVCHVTFTRSDLLSWASHNLQSEAWPRELSYTVIKNAWHQATDKQMDALKEMLREVPPKPPGHPDSYYEYLGNTFGMRRKTQG